MHFVHIESPTEYTPAILWCKFKDNVTEKQQWSCYPQAAGVAVCHKVERPEVIYGDHWHKIVCHQLQQHYSLNAAVD